VGRPRIGPNAMTPAERQRRRRAKLAEIVGPERVLADLSLAYARAYLGDQDAILAGLKRLLRRWEKDAAANARWRRQQTAPEGEIPKLRAAGRAMNPPPSPPARRKNSTEHREKGEEEKGRRITFTPERIRQIKNLVEYGKSREEIAEVVGVTIGSLQVTCSRLGISLRRPRHPPDTLKSLGRISRDD
jgi:hypothetical protein